MTVSVADLRGRLARVLRMVEGGRDVVVTRHGDAIAKLVPVREETDKLEAIGVHPAECPGPLKRVRPVSTELSRSLAQTVLQERA